MKSGDIVDIHFPMRALYNVKIIAFRPDDTVLCESEDGREIIVKHYCTIESRSCI